MDNPEKELEEFLVKHLVVVREQAIKEERSKDTTLIAIMSLLCFLGGFVLAMMVSTMYKTNEISRGDSVICNGTPRVDSNTIHCQ